MNPWEVPPPPPTTEAEFFNDARWTVFLLVEGGSDEHFWVARVDRRKCQVRAMDGKENALRELRTAQSEARTGIIAVLDADFDRIEGTLVEDADIIWTDLHDLETTLVASPALDKVLAEVGSRKKCEAFERDRCRIRNALLANAIDLGRLRWLSRREKLDLQFKKLRPKQREFRYIDYGDFCDRASWKVDSKKLITTVLHFCSRHDLKPDELLTRMARLPQIDDGWQLCVGHDLVGLLLVGLRSKLGNGHKLSIEDMQERLRLAFERGDLERTTMYTALREWEKRNSRYRIFSW